MTFCLDADLATPDANVLAIPTQPVRVLTASSVTPAASFFGFHTMRLPYAPLTEVTCGWVRSHDSSLRWDQIETSAGVFDWSRLDSWVAVHSAAGRDLCLVLFGTPTFYSARASEDNAYHVLGIAAEPSDLTKWDAFCTAVATRYPQIGYYEIWNEPNASGFWTGTQTLLAQLTRRASQAIKAVRPSAKILCPAVTSWSPTAAQSAETYFTNMMNASDGAAGTMKQWVDIVAVHLYTSGNAVNNVPGIIDRVKAAMTTLSISGKEIWDTESAPISPDASLITTEAEVQYMKRSLVMMIAKGIARQCYYTWDHTTMGIKDNAVLVSTRNAFVSSLMNDGIQYATALWDGRVAYYSGGQLYYV